MYKGNMVMIKSDMDLTTLIECMEVAYLGSHKRGVGAKLYI